MSNEGEREGERERKRGGEGGKEGERGEEGEKQRDEGRRDEDKMQMIIYFKTSQNLKVLLHLPHL